MRGKAISAASKLKPAMNRREFTQEMVFVPPTRRVSEAPLLLKGDARVQLARAVKHWGSTSQQQQQRGRSLAPHHSPVPGRLSGDYRPIPGRYSAILGEVQGARCKVSYFLTKLGDFNHETAKFDHDRLCLPVSFCHRRSFPLSFFRCVLASLYEGLSVRRSVGPSVRRSVRPSVRRLVGHAFVKNKRNQYF